MRGVQFLALLALCSAQQHALATPAVASADACTHGMCEAGGPASDATPADGVVDEWVTHSICGGAEPELMAPRACHRMVASEQTECEDLHEECDDWAADGVCDEDPEFMAAACKVSCAACTVYFLPDGVNPYITLGEPGLIGAEYARRRKLEIIDGRGGARPGVVDGGEGASLDLEEEVDDDYDGTAQYLVTAPAVGLATAGLGEATVDAVANAISAGYTMIDTGEAQPGYRQDLVRRGILQARKARESLFLIATIRAKRKPAKATRAAFKQTLKVLGTAYIDLLLLHTPRCDPDREACDKLSDNSSDWEDTWAEMENLYNDGEVRALGVSGFNNTELEQLMMIAFVKPSMLKAPANPLTANRALLHLCLENGVNFMSTSLLGAGGGEADAAASGAVLSHPVIQGIARKHSASPAQVVIRWALQHGMMALLGPIEPHQPVAEALAAHRLALDEDDLDAINALDGAQLPRASPWGLS